MECALAMTHLSVRSHTCSNLAPECGVDARLSFLCVIKIVIGRLLFPGEHLRAKKGKHMSSSALVHALIVRET